MKLSKLFENKDNAFDTIHKLIQTQLVMLIQSHDESAEYEETVFIISDIPNTITDQQLVELAMISFKGHWVAESIIEDRFDMKSQVKEHPDMLPDESSISVEELQEYYRVLTWTQYVEITLQHYGEEDDFED